MRIFRGVIREYFKWLGQRAGLAVAAAVSCFVLLAPISLFGRELDFRGQKVTVEGLAEGDWEYVGGDSVPETLSWYSSINSPMVRTLGGRNQLT